MSNNAFTPETLKTGVGDNLFEAIENSAINAGANFLNGKATNTFNKINSSIQNSEVGKVTSEAIENTVGMITTVSSLSINPDDLKNITESIIAETSNILLKQTSKHTTDKISKLITKIVNSQSIITDRSLKYFVDNKKTVGEVIKEKLVKTDEQETNNSDIELQNNSDIFSKKYLENVEKIKKEVNEKIKKVSTKVNTITSYIENGPEWVSAEINKYVNNVSTDINNYVDNKVDPLINNVDNYINEQSKVAGTFMVEKYNNVLDKSADKIINLQNKTIKKAKIKAEVIKRKAILKLAGMIGL